MESERLTVAGPEERTLDVEVAGPPGGATVVLHSGTPAAGVLFGPLVAAGAERGMRHVTYSRPGYSASDRRPGRTVADCVADVHAIADALGVERLFTLGWSGGGPHALACAALMGERVLAAATIGGVAPYGAKGLDWLAGMGEENVQEFGAARAGEQQLLAYLEAASAEMMQTSGEDIRAVLGDLLSDVDREALSGDFAAYLAASAKAGLLHGVWGWYDDDVAFLQGWGFDVARMARPVTIWHGGQDRFVPYAHGEWLAANVAGARARLLPEHGHLSLGVASYGEILDDLLESGA